MLYEKYRPKMFKQMVGRNDEIELIKKQITKPDGISHLLLTGPQGTGKTTFAFATAREALGDTFASNFYEYNGSDVGVELVRNEIVNIAKRRAFESDYKIILIDEADKITPDAQGAFRRILEKYAQYTKFIFTANYVYKLIPPIISRFLHFRFEKLDMKDIAKYLKYICKKEGIEKSNNSLISIAKVANGDLRKAIGILEGNGQIDSGLFELTLKKLNSMSNDEKIELAFKNDPDILFNILWEIVHRNKQWDKIQPMADCSAKMAISIHKTIFLANLLNKHF